MKIVVFGAGGFIGGWICEYLAIDKDVELVACVRSWASAVRLARRGLKISRADIEDESSYSALIAGADAVINASVPEPDKEPQAVLHLYKACAAAGVKKFIQFSSIAVYGDQTGVIDESQELQPTNEYGRAKAEAERLLIASSVANTQIVILRPTIVYGPFSENWTVRYARRISYATWRPMGWAANGFCNLVHGADVAKAAIQACFVPSSAQSLILNVNGPEIVTWNDYIASFGAALGVDNSRAASPILFRLRASGIEVVRVVGSRVKRSALRRAVSSSRTFVDAAQSLVASSPNKEELKLLRRKVRYSWDRAAREINFTPMISLADGLKQSSAWCMIHGVTPKPVRTGGSPAASRAEHDHE